MTSAFRVLLVEDTESDAKLIALELRKASPHLEITRVDTADAMRAALGGVAWEIVLSDWSMPEFSAPAALAVLREKNLDVPFIIVSGTIGEEHAVEAMRAGAHDFILKDKLGRLRPAIERALRDGEERAARRHAEDALRQSEEALRASEARTSRLLKASRVGLWDWDLATREVYFSPEWKAQLGYADDELPNRFEEWSTRVHPSDLQPTLAAVEAYHRTAGTTYDVEFRMRHKDGSWRWISARADLVRDAKGTATRMMGSHVDITERREADLSFQAIFEGSPVGILQTDASKVFVRANAAFCRFVEYSAGELEGMSVFDLTHPEDRAMTQEGYRKFESTDDVLTNFDKRCVTKSGRVVWGRVSSRSVSLAAGNHFVTVVEDITEMKAAQSLLDATQAIGKIGNWSFDLNTHWLTWSKEHFEIFEIPSPQSQDALYLLYRSRIHPDDVASLDEVVERAKKTGQGFTYLHRVVLEDGRLKHVEGIGAVTLDSTGMAVVVSGTCQDITERKRVEEERAQLEAQLHHAQKMDSVGRLAGGVAHDFNNMLGVILANTELALEHVDPASSLKEDLEEVRKAAVRSAALTRQLLAFARKQATAPAVLDVNDRVEEILAMLRRLLGENIQLARLAAADVWPVYMDASQLDQVLTNLCVNARDAISTVGTLTIETANFTVDAEYSASHLGAVPGDCVRLTVRDDGCGIDEETLSHIFEPFFTTKPVSEGTGLGLATVHGIVMQNKGSIEVESEPGQGTTFTILLPRHHGIAGPAVERRAEATAPGHETILIVEDEPALLSVTRRMLERMGYAVLMAGTPAEAMRQAEQHGREIHLLLSDVVMPEMSGPDLARNLMSRHPHLKLVFMSGYPATVNEQRRLLENSNFLQKPFSGADLAAKVREALDDPPKLQGKRIQSP